MKETIGLIAVILTFVGYIPYIKDTIKGNTTPHVYTWFMWALVPSIVFAIQLSSDAGPGAFASLAAAIVCFIIFLLGLRNGEKNISRMDTGFFVLSFVALCMWLFAKEPIISVVLVLSIDMLGFVPTIRKSWRKPYEETLVSYEISTIRFLCALFALDRYTIVTALYPLTWVVANGLFCVYLIYRRGKVGSPVVS